MKNIILVFIFLFSSQAFSAGDDIIKTWRDKQEAYFKGEALVQSNSVQAAQKLSNLLGKYNWEKTEKARLTHKLAELYLGIGRVDETQNNIKTASSTKKSLALFKRIIKDYPRYEKLEHVLFSYGFELFMRGQHKESYNVLTKLNTKYPRSEFTIDAFVIRADSKFEMKHFNSSIKLYQRAINSKNYELASYSSYRKAWAQFNALKYNQAYKSLVRVILNNDTKIDKRIINPRKEARYDLARFYHKQTTTFKPYIDIKGLISKNKLEQTLSDLAQFYYDSGSWNKSVTTYTALIKNFSNSKNVAIYHLKKGIALSTRKNIVRSSNEIAAGLSKCRENRCRTIANDDIFKLVNNWEKHWRKHQSSKSYLLALKTVYPKLADAAVDKKEKSKIYLLLAEIEIFSKNYNLASISYEKAYLNNKSAGYANEAFWESINSLTKVKKTGWNKSSIKRLEKITGSYIEKFPSSKRSISAQNFLARIYIKNNKVELATNLYKSLSHKYIYKNTGDHAYNNYLKTKLKNKEYRDITYYLLEYKKLDKKKKRYTTLNSDLDKAYEDWSQIKIRSKKFSPAIKILKEALKNRKQSKIAHDWKWNLSYTYLAAKKHRLAAESFMSYEAIYKNRKNKQIPALNNALVSYKKIRNNKKSIFTADKLSVTDWKNRDNWLIEKALLLKIQRKSIESFKTLSKVKKTHPRKNLVFLEVIHNLNKKEVKQVLNSNLNGYTNESIAELVLRLITTISDIDDKATKTAAVSLINIKSNNKNYQAKGHYFVGMHEMRKFSKRKYTITSRIERPLDRMIKKIMSIDVNFREAIQSSTDETQAKALIAMGNLYSLVPKKYQAYTKTLIKNKKSTLSVKNLISPFFNQSKVYWKEARRSISAIKNKKDRSKLERLLEKSKKSSLALENWYIKSSKIQLITKRGNSNEIY